MDIICQFFVAGSSTKISGIVGLDRQLSKTEKSFNLGSLKDIERRDLNCAVKEYLLLAGYKLTAMSFYEEVHTNCFLLHFTSKIQF